MRLTDVFNPLFKLSTVLSTIFLLLVLCICNKLLYYCNSGSPWGGTGWRGDACDPPLRPLTKKTSKGLIDNLSSCFYIPDMGLSNTEMLRSFSQDRALALSVIFNHRHTSKSPPMHVHIIDAWRSKDELVQVEGFRECAKSTLSEEFLLLESAFQNFRYCLLIGETYTKACQRLESIKHEATKNMKLAGLFGKLRGGAGFSWNENIADFANGSRIEALGWEQEIRGFKHHDARPDRAYLDDIENKERVRDTAAVDATMRKLYLELLPAMDKETRKIRVTGTPLADDCMINRNKSNSEWVCFSFPICIGDIDDAGAVAQWPERYPMDWIRAERRKFEQAGQLRGFMQEYMLVAAETQGKPFTERDIRSVEVAPVSFSPKHAILDPARTANITTSDQTGGVVVSRIGSTIYVHESDGDFLKPDQIVQRAFDWQKKWDTAQVHIEKNSLDEWLLQPIRLNTLKSGVILNYKPLQAPQDRDKTTFIMGLQPFLNAGDIVLVGGKVKHPKLVAQILNFPVGKKDVLNALAYALKIFSGEAVYKEFSEDNIGRDLELGRGDALVLVLNSEGAQTTAVLCGLDGQNITVLADWVSQLPVVDALSDIATLIRAVYQGRRLSCWVPADIYDLADRHPLVAGARKAGLSPMRGGYVAQCRGQLAPLLRTEMRGKRMLMVDTRAVNTLNALSGSYAYASKKNGMQTAEPERGVYRAIGESLESLTSAIITGGQADVMADATNKSTNGQGVTYLTSMPNRGSRRG